MTPTPTAKSKSKSKSKATAKKKAPPAKKKGKKKGGLHSVTYVSKGGKQSGKWTEEEEALLLEAMKEYDKSWEKVADHIGTRTPVSTLCVVSELTLPLRMYLHFFCINHLPDDFFPSSLLKFITLRPNANPRTRKWNCGS